MNFPLEHIELKIINLKHRADRRDESASELLSAGIIFSPKFIFPAKATPGHGAYGCALSHATVLAEYLFESEKPFALILEDDFQIKDPDNFLPTLVRAAEIAKDWDTFLMGHNQAIPIEPTRHPTISRCINAQTAVAYITKREFAHRLIFAFHESALGLWKYQTLPEPNRRHTLHAYSLDILWKELQLRYRFCASFPDLVTQRSSFSDIENKVVHYAPTSLA
jgi:glycosyl transferase family 25